MKKYIIDYEDYDDILGLLGHGVPHTNLENVTTVIVDLTEEEFHALVGTGIKIIENPPCKLLSSWPADMPYRSLTPNPPYIATYLNMMNARIAGFSGTGVNIALMDSGCLNSNADLSNPTLIRQDYTGMGASGDTEGHGSKACCIFQQKYSFFTGLEVNYGLAYGAQLYSMRVLEGGAAAIISAISWSIANNIHIINISLAVGGGLTTAINAAIDAGIIVVCASGNDLSSEMAHPANIFGVIAVSSVDNVTAGMPLAGSYLTSDGHIGICVVMYSGGAFEFFVGGTSQAAFQISALMAIYKQKYPTLTTPKAINLLRRKALQMTGQTYTTLSSTYNTLLSYQTGAGFVSPIN